jgi:simple sugar transport system permease protein
MSMFYIGGELAQSRMQLPKSITGVFQGLLLFSLLASDTLILYRLRWVAARRGPAQTSAARAAT